MSAVLGAGLTGASAAVAWTIAASVARRRRLVLGWTPIFAAGCAVAFAALVPAHDGTHAVLLGGVAVAAANDARTGLIFTPLTNALAAAVLAAAALDGHVRDSATGALALGSTLYALHALTAGRGIGLGDVRLGIGLGAGLGVAGGFFALGWAFASGGALALALLLTRRVRRDDTMRFAPFMAAGVVAVLLPAVVLP